MDIKRLPVFGRKATTPSGVLRQAHRLLAQEGRWIQRQWFGSHDFIDPQKPLCSQGWGSCAEGAVQAVIFGVPVKEQFDGTCDVVDYSTVSDGSAAQLALYWSTLDHLSGPASDLLGPGHTIVDLNDHDSTDRETVLQAFWKAYRRAQSVERKARQRVAA